MIVPTGIVHKATASGAVVKELACRHCGRVCFYILHRTGRGRTTAPFFIGSKRAKQQAMVKAGQHLEWLLHHGRDPVPCLACGKFDAEMIPAARDLRFRLRWALVGASIAFLIPALVAVAAPDPGVQELAGAVSVLAAGLVLGCFFVARALYDPNRQAEKRIGISSGAGPFSSIEEANEALRGAA